MNDDSEHSQSDTITYDDPAGRMEREKIMAQLKRGCSPSPDFPTEDEEDDRRYNTTVTVGVICNQHARLETLNHNRELLWTLISGSSTETTKCIFSSYKICLQFGLHVT